MHLKVSLLGLILLCVQSTAQAGLFDDEEARKAILDLRQKVELMGQTQDKKLTAEVQGLRDENQLLKKGLLDLQTVIEQVRSEMSKQTGAYEQLTKDVSDLQRRQRDAVQVVDERLRKFEPVKVNPDGKEFMADPAEVREFEAALALFRKSEFKLASQSFAEFIRRYPQSGYQSLALFWLGNAQYANRDYKEAIAYFKASSELNPASTKAPESLLAIANSQIELKDVRGARKTLEDLIRIYPQAEAAVAARDRLARLK